MMYKNVFLSLGSNMGNREKNLADALKYISGIASACIKSVSHIYETEPVGYKEQDKFLNMAAFISTSLEPLELLEKLQEIEGALKRVREIHWGPRTIDIDILLYGDEKLDLPKLTVPHPRMLERAFVLIPLKDISPDRKINNMDIDNLINKCDDKDGVRLYKEIWFENSPGLNCNFY